MGCAVTTFPLPRRPSVMKRDRYGWGWTIRLTSIEEATQILAIADPVNVCITATMDARTLGAFDREKDGVWQIYLNRFLTTTDASVTLWHELVHLVQAETAGGMQTLDDRRDRELRAARLEGSHQRRLFRLRAYRNLPLEREAEQRAQALHEQLPLATTRDQSRAWQFRSTTAAETDTDEPTTSLLVEQQL